MIYDFCILGGGIVGLATSLELSRRTGASVLLLEEELSFARHQTGHNSGVIHAGLYYKPGSLKADLCRRGAEATKRFCSDHGVLFKTPGKLVVATNACELARLRALADNARVNRIEFSELDAAELHEREPNIVGLGAIHSPSTAIVDYAEICSVMGELIRERGHHIAMNVAVDVIREEAEFVRVKAGARSWKARWLIACAGLQSDRIACLAGLAVEHQIIPFRGGYFDIVPAKRSLVHHLIYPVPDPDLPFLGIHLTPLIDGGLTVGPNAVLGFGREGYAQCAFDIRDVLTFATFPGLWRVMAKNWRSGIGEARNSFSKKRCLAECQKYCPSLNESDLIRHEAGIRAQAVLRDGTLVHDFLFLKSKRMLHVCNALSPAATSALPIAELIAQEVIGRNAAAANRSQYVS